MVMLKMIFHLSVSRLCVEVISNLEALDICGGNMVMEACAEPSCAI